MPYRSKKQRAYLHIHEPALAAKWDRETGGKVVPGKKPVAFSVEREARRKKKR